MRLQKILEFKYWPQIAVLGLLFAGYVAYRYFAYYDTRSNDAYVSANMVNIASLVSGPVTHIYVKENQKVKKGDKLIDIDPLPYTYAVQQAKAKLNIAKLNYENEKANVIKAEQRLKATQIQLNLSQDHYERYSKLQSKGDMAKITLINLADKMKEQVAAIKEAEEQLRIAQTNLDDNEILAAQAELAQANYLLDHTTLVAPDDGYITNFNLRVGQYVEVGEGLFAFIETKQWWVVTRYRETAIRLIQPGDKAKIMIDMYPGKVFHGHVDSIGWGINRVQSGNVAPSTLVYLEATEDWIRIAQRFPVRIYIDDLTDEYPMRIGANATTITYR
ncbi:efflux RND transporter periplasmic adaptor subunit [Legionella sp. PATHC038]|uniref:efflux RND transporter periplasmic adaptor subunit n=1 Tax=Legionella sheltonii TaxID=2992041 RepID=UPI0022433B8F|nr:efflux RND transporter periplasmic adaptor subunit [Legionella sp. PATHC038]MCW8400232.1 efflux RND transporter periplasmic adaptor subunit [Legionella sp. PATHC038]